jgi:quercetin dioxygenase-like cupin family protein
MKFVDEKDITPLQFPGRSLTLLFSPENGSEQMTTAISKVPPGGMLPWHAHENSDEIIYVLQGRGTASHETLDEPIDIYPGRGLFMPKGKKHCIENKGDTEMRLYCTFSPAIAFAAPKD